MTFMETAAIARSYLYVPGDRSDRLDKALDRAGDSLIADLEDAVAQDRKEYARDTVTQWLQGLATPRPAVWVRVNAGARMMDDIAAVAVPVLTGVVVPKADAVSVRRAGEALGEAERAAGSQVGRILIAPLIETAVGMLELSAIAAEPRVSHLGIGEADLTAELGIEPSPGEPELLPLRLQLVVASAAAGKAAPTGPVSTNIRDQSGLEASSRALRRLGFGARSALHPDQVAPIEAAFTPSDAEVARAREVVDMFDAAGRGSAVDARGRFIDEAVVRSARRVLLLAQRLGL